jgi:hypothetical protein
MDDLIQRIEAAEGADRALDLEIALLVGTKARNGHLNIANHYTASIDAALTLVPEGYDWSLDNFDGDQGMPRAWVCKDGPFYIATAAIAALALCAAALKTHIERTAA